MFEQAKLLNQTRILGPTIPALRTGKQATTRPMLLSRTLGGLRKVPLGSECFLVEEMPVLCLVFLFQDEGRSCPFQRQHPSAKLLPMEKLKKTSWSLEVTTRQPRSDDCYGFFGEGGSCCLQLSRATSSSILLDFALGLVLPGL